MISQIHAATSGTGTGTGTSGTSSTTGTSSSSSTSAGLSGTGNVSLGGTDFLTLMLAQLKNQDPTSPVDSNAFLSQLAELSTVEGINSLNTSFGTLANSLTSSQALQASSLLGHQALVQSSSVDTSTDGQAITGAVNVPETSSSVTVDITNSSGVLVNQINLGAQSSGMADFSWNGKQGDGSAAPAGTYSVNAIVEGAAKGTAISTYINGTVESVTMGSGSSTGTSTTSTGTSGLTLNVAGLGSVPFSEVAQISN